LISLIVLVLDDPRPFEDEDEDEEDTKRSVLA
jgi:hypothetical protein